MNWKLSIKYFTVRFCNDLLLNGYSDWFLPSLDELELMFQRKTIIGGFVDAFYWSSSEYDADHAWLVYFGFLGQSIDIKGGGPYAVRAIRAF
ncbi:MAG: DUF1566 domain-containing protein [Bacteroidales bacterium]|jgi:hypothetical protein|nr:DUF1566 domain-containing protein [Bacteroidales bacterium]